MLPNGEATYMRLCTSLKTSLKSHCHEDHADYIHMSSLFEFCILVNPYRKSLQLVFEERVSKIQVITEAKLFQRNLNPCDI